VLSTTDALPLSITCWHIKKIAGTGDNSEGWKGETRQKSVDVRDVDVSEYFVIDLAIPERLVPLDPSDASAGMRACRLAGDGVILLRLHDR